MPERKVWTPEEDKILKYLREDLKIHKWSIIAKKMVEQYSMAGRTGKQCRQRYHNHLDSSIVHSQWTREQQQFLYDLHSQIGNKWAIIAQKMPGRSDNCVKNHFYSKMRKAIRKLNKVVYEHFRKEIKEIKINVLYKIVQATDEKFKANPTVEPSIYEKCYELKSQLLEYSNDQQNSFDGHPNRIKQLALDIQNFNVNYRKKSKKTRRSSFMGDDGINLPRFEPKQKIVSEDEEEDSEYSMVFSLDKQEDDQMEEEEIVPMEAVPQSLEELKDSSNSAINKFLYGNSKKENIQKQQEEVKKIQPCINANTSKKTKLQMSSDKVEIQNILMNEGALRFSDSVTLEHKNGLSKPPTMKQRSIDSSFRSGDDLQLSLGMDEENMNMKMLGDSLEGLRIQQYQYDDVGVEDEDKLFIST